VFACVCGAVQNVREHLQGTAGAAAEAFTAAATSEAVQQAMAAVGGPASVAGGSMGLQQGARKRLHRHVHSSYQVCVRVVSSFAPTISY
jgi:hypothetical protein